MFQEYNFIVQVLSRIKSEFEDEKWGNGDDEIKNMDQCKNKTKGIILAALLWHIWLERNRHIFSGKKNLSPLSIFYHINSAVDLWIGQGQESQGPPKTGRHQRRDPRRRLDVIGLLAQDEAEQQRGDEHQEEAREDGDDNMEGTP